MDQDLLTCICCRHTFESPTAQRDHYRSDYHRFNLKRKVVGLPPVTEDLFKQKLQELKDKQTTTEVFSGYCNFCKKKFTNRGTYDMHLTSKKHLEREQLARDRAEDETLTGTTSTITKRPIEDAESKTEEKKQEGEKETPDSEKTEEEFIAEKVRNAYKFEENQCIVCMQRNNSFEENLEHMAKEHGLYIPDLEYVTDLQALIAYLGEKVGTGNVCLYCNKIFRNTEAVQNHMKSLTHSKIRYDAEDLAELEDFYDFSKTWEGVEGEGDYDVDSDITEDQQKQLILNTGKGVVGIDEDGSSLTLANGKTIGHRDFFLLYKRNYHRIINRDPNATKAVLNRYRALGWKTALTEKERVAQRKQNQRYFKEHMQVGVKSNRLQKFFREQVLY